MFVRPLYRQQFDPPCDCLISVWFCRAVVFWFVFMQLRPSRLTTHDTVARPHTIGWTDAVGDTRVIAAVVWIFGELFFAMWQLTTISSTSACTVRTRT